MNQTTVAQRDKLMQDLRVVIRDAEELMKSTGEEFGNGAADWRAQAQDRLSSVQHRLQSLQHDTVDRVVSAGRTTQAYVQENPWKSIGIASSVALIAGFLMNRR